MNQDVLQEQINPYNNPVLASNLIDLDCDCVQDIKTSVCGRHFASFAQCHNRVLLLAMRGREAPDLRKCMSAYKRMNTCLTKIGLHDTKLIEK